MKPIIFYSLLFILFISACKPASNEHEKTDDNTSLLSDTLSPLTGKRLVSNYEGRLYHVQKVLGFDDSRCIWFSARQIQSLLDRIKQEGGDGIRFYLAAYDKDTAMDIRTPNIYRDHSTLVMVSTRDSAGIHIDYFNGKANNRRGGIITATPENQGELCPPPAQCYTMGAKLLE